MLGVALAAIAGCSSGESTTSPATVGSAAVTATAGSTSAQASNPATTSVATLATTLGTTDADAAVETPPAPDDPGKDPAIFEFGESTSVDGWRSQSDPVMGGVSTGSVSWADGALVFEGNVSLDNGGGFSSIVSPTFESVPAWSTSDGISIEFMGDDKTYVLQVRTSTGNWVQRFVAANDVRTTRTLAWPDFEPVDRFLDPITGDAELDRAAIDTLAIYIVDKQEGPFRLELVSIR
jgi:hypothetical protein